MPCHAMPYASSTLTQLCQSANRRWDRPCQARVDQMQRGQLRHVVNTGRQGPGIKPDIL